MPYFDELRTFRERAGITMSKLAREAKVDRATISRAEKHKNLTSYSLRKIIHALNEIHYTTQGSSIDYDKVVSELSKYHTEEKSELNPLGIVFDPHDVSDKKVAEFVDLLSGFLGMEIEIVRSSTLPPTPYKGKKVA